MREKDVEIKGPCRHTYCIHQGGYYLLYMLRILPETVIELLKEPRFNNCNCKKEIQETVNEQLQENNTQLSN